MTTFRRLAFVALLALPVLPANPAAAQAPQTGAAAPAPAPNLRPYRINPGDELQIYVWGEERLQRQIRVLPDGSFSFPLVGRVNAVGRLPAELEQQISQGLTEQYRGQVPQVTVSVVTPAGYQFNVVGKVRGPGTQSPGRYVNVLEAIGLAGGPTEFADVNNITILRKDGDRLSTLRVRLSGALRGSPSERDLTAGGIPELQSGDTVIVP